MFLKRYFFLVFCVSCFVLAYIGRFELSRAQMESRFREERIKFNVEDKDLIAAAKTDKPAPEAPAAPAVPTQPAPQIIESPAPAEIQSTPPTPASPVSPDLSTPSPQPPASDSNAAPLAPTTPSTINYPTGRGSSAAMIRWAAYHPGQGMVQVPATPVPTTVAPAAPIAPVAPRPLTSPVATAPAATNSPATLIPAPAEAPPTSVIVLLYHQFVPAGTVLSPKLQWTMRVDTFEAEMKYIHDNGYNVIPMSDLVKFLKHEITVPPKSVVITIDDGYKSAVVHAAPILKKYGYPWTFFVYPDFITEAESKGSASWNDLRKLQAEGVDIESHSMSHPTLTSHTHKINGVVRTLNAEEYEEWLIKETTGSKLRIEEKLGTPVTSFAYPYGAYNKAVEEKVLAAGYQAVFTVADNPVRGTTSMHSIGRYTITQNVEKNFAAYLRQGALGVGDVEPAPGSTISNPRPVISAVLGYSGKIDPKSIETVVRDFGEVRHDFDPATLTLRLYLPRDLVRSPVLVNLRMRDAETNGVLVANWFFNYEPTTGEVSHPPIGTVPSAVPAAPVIPATPAASAVAPVPAPAKNPVTQ